MAPPDTDAPRLAPALLAVLAAVLLTASLVPLASEVRDAGSTLEQLLPAQERARIARAQAVLGTSTEASWVVLEGSWSEDRLESLESELARLEGVRHVARGRELESLGLAQNVQLLQLELEPSAIELEGARRLNRACRDLFTAVRGEGERAYAVGLPRLRAESWDLARAELQARLPLLGMLALLVPWIFLGSLGAGALALVLAACTTALTLWTYRLVGGPPSSLVLLVIPLLWAVATMDALHLAGRVARLSGRSLSNAARVRRARRELWGPCLVTTLTTAVGFLGLGTLGPSGLLRGLGLASALGVVLAFVLTFTLGIALVERLPLGSPPRWPRRLALGWIGAARRSPRPRWIGAGIVLALGVAAVPGLSFGSRFPHVFSPGTPVARDLDHLAHELDTDLASVEVLLQPATENARRLPNLVGAVAVLARELEARPGIRTVLPLDALSALPTPEAGLDPLASQERLAAFLSRPELARWVRPTEGAARLELHFTRDTDWATKRATLRHLEHLDRKLLDHYELVFAGPGYAAFRVEELGLEDLEGSALISLAVLVLVLGLGMHLRGGGWRPAAVVLASSLLPLGVLPIALTLLDTTWSLALLPLPSLLLGLAVDDSVHLTWRSRGRVRLAALPAIAATTILVAASVGTLGTSALSANRDLGILLAVGLVVALVADLTLLPALVGGWRRVRA